MKTGTALAAALSTLAIAAISFATQIGAPHDPVENIVAKHMTGAWKLDRDVTSRLNPDRTLILWEHVTFTSDVAALDQLRLQRERLNISEIYYAGRMSTATGNYPFMLYGKEGNVSLLWVYRSKDGALMDARVVNMALAVDAQDDLLFLGGPDGARGAGACFIRE
jgi:hypothetical protein